MGEIAIMRIAVAPNIFVLKELKCGNIEELGVKFPSVPFFY
jgi:hypothetical protein